MKEKTVFLLAGILLFSQLVPKAAAQEGGPFVGGSGMTGDFLLGVSYYGAIEVPVHEHRRVGLFPEVQGWCRRLGRGP